MLLAFDKALASAGSLLTVGVTVTARPARGRHGGTGAPSDPGVARRESSWRRARARTSSQASSTKSARRSWAVAPAGVEFLAHLLAPPPNQPVPSVDAPLQARENFRLRVVGCCHLSGLRCSDGVLPACMGVRG